MRYTYLFWKRIYLVIDEPAFSLATFFLYLSWTRSNSGDSLRFRSMWKKSENRVCRLGKLNSRAISFACPTWLIYNTGEEEIPVISQVANSPRGIALLKTFPGSNWIPRIALIYFGRLLHDSFAMNLKFVPAASTRICNQSTLIDESYE